MDHPDSSCGSSEGPPEPRPVTSTPSAWELLLGHTELWARVAAAGLGLEDPGIHPFVPGSVSERPLSEAPNLFHTWGRPQQGMCRPLAASRTKPHPGLGLRSLVARARAQTFLSPLDHRKAPRGRRPDAPGFLIHPHLHLLHLPGPQSQSLLPAPLPAPGDLGRRGGRLVDAAVGRGALAVDVEIVAVLLPVYLLLEAQNHAPVALARLLVTLGLVELACGEWSTRTLRSQEASESGPGQATPSSRGAHPGPAGAGGQGRGPASHIPSPPGAPGMWETHNHGSPTGQC